MKRSKLEENEGISYDGKVLARNSFYNLLGYGLPLLVALIILPPLIDQLGIERFAVLNLCWIVVGYFSILDFGIGKALTKVVSEKIGSNQINQIPNIFWTSLFLMFLFSAITSAILFLLVPEILDVFEVSPELFQETKSSLYLLVLSIPLVTTTAGLRGVLEAYQKFGIINIVRILMGIFTFVGPLIIFLIFKSLFWIVLFLVVIRLIIWIIYLLNCFNLNNQIKSKISLNIGSIKPILKFSIWITLANLIGPIILYSDRIIIGAFIEVSALTYYSTPYEVITKLMIIPTSLVAVLFPVFSSTFYNNPDLSKKYLVVGLKVIFLMVYPIVFLVTMFSYEAIYLWLGELFAIKSYRVLQFLAVGILMNALSLIMNNCIQGIGKPRIPTIINILELPIYIFVMWFFVNSMGIEGAALAYMLMATFDVIIMYSAANKVIMLKLEKLSLITMILSLCILIIIPLFTANLPIKILLSLLFILIFSITVWKNLLDKNEKSILLSRLRISK